MKYKFTVFTPTYNRADTLKRVFDSLMKQKIKHSDFEWILIDDGSTDNTNEIVKDFVNCADFEISYIKQKNMGKNYCYNKAIKLAKGELFLILDSDDEIVPECMSTFWTYWDKLNLTYKKEIYGISCLCVDGNTNKLIGHKTEEGLIEDAFIWKHKNKMYFDFWAALNTSLFKSYFFPEIENVKFIPESYIWDQVSFKRKIYATNEVLKVVYYQKNGLSNKIIESYKKHSKGFFIYYQMTINKMFWSLLKLNSLRLIKDIIQYIRVGLHNNYTVYELTKGVNRVYKKFLILFFLPVGFYFYLKDKFYKGK